MVLRWNDKEKKSVSLGRKCVVLQIITRRRGNEWHLLCLFLSWKVNFGITSQFIASFGNDTPNLRHRKKKGKTFNLRHVEYKEVN